MTKTKTKTVLLTGLALALISSFAVLSPWRVGAASTISLGAEALLPGAGDRDAYAPSVAFGADKYLVSWQVGRATTGDLVAAMVDSSGAPEGQLITLSNAADDQERPRAAFGAGVFFVVWQDLRNGRDYDLYGARVSTAGVVLDPQGIAIAAGEKNQANPAVAFDGTHFVVVYEDRQSGRYEVHSKRVSSDGQLVDSAPLVVARHDSRHRFEPAIACRADGHCLVIWCGNIPMSSGNDVRSGGSLITAGALVSEYTLDGDDNTTWGNRHNPLDLAGDGAGWLAVWQTFHPVGRSGTQNTPSRISIDAAGALGSPATITNSAVIAPAVVHDGDSFVVAFGAQREDTNVSSFFDSVHLRKLDGSDELHVAGSFDAPAKAIKIASDGAQRGLVVYEKHPAISSEPIRVGVRPFFTAR